MLKLRLLADRCKAQNKSKYQCWNFSLQGYEYCWSHLAKHIIDELRAGNRNILKKIAVK